MKLISLFFIFALLFSCGGSDSVTEVGPENSGNSSSLSTQKTATPQGNQIPQNTSQPNSGVFKIQILHPSESTLVDLGGTTKIVFKVNGDYKENSIRFKVNNNEADISKILSGNPREQATIQFNNDATTLKTMKFYNKYDNQMFLTSQSNSGDSTSETIVLKINLADPNILMNQKDTKCKCNKPCMQVLTAFQEKDVKVNNDFIGKQVVLIYNKELNKWNVLPSVQTPPDQLGLQFSPDSNYTNVALDTLLDQNPEESTYQTAVEFLGISQDEAEKLDKDNINLFMIFSEQVGQNLKVANGDLTVICQQYRTKLSTKEGNDEIKILISKVIESLKNSALSACKAYYKDPSAYGAF